MHKLPPILKTVQNPVKPVTASKEPSNNQLKKNNIDDIDDSATEKTPKKDNLQKTDTEFLDLMAEQDTGELSTDIDAELQIAPEATPSIALALTDDISKNKIIELNLDGDAIVEIEPSTINLPMVKPLEPTEQFTNDAAAAAQMLASNGGLETKNLEIENLEVENVEIKSLETENIETKNVETKNTETDSSATIADNAATIDDKIPSVISSQQAVATEALTNAVVQVQKLINDGQAGNVAPEQLATILDDAQTILTDLKAINGKLVNDPEKLANLTQQAENLIEKLNQSIKQGDGIEPEKLKQAFVKLAQAAESTETKPLSPKDAEQLIKHISNKNAESQTAKSTESQVQKAGETEQSSTNQASVETSKYAGRYNQTANNQNSQQGLTGTDGKSSVESDSTANLTAIYNNAKSNVKQTQSTANTMSALDKINDKNPMDFLSQLQNTTSSQSLDANTEENVINVKLAMNNNKLAQNLPLNSMAFQVSKQFNKGNSEFQIRLDPAELGRINIKLTLKQGGNVKAHIVVERNDVFELLQRDARALEQALNDAGFDDKNVDVELSLDQNANQGGSFAEKFFDQSADNDNEATKNAAAAEDEAIELIANHIPLNVTSTAVNRII